MKIIRKGFLMTLEVVLILVLTTTLVFAADIVTNGDFSSLTGSQPDYWTPWSGDTIVADATGACGVGIATVQDGGDSMATAQQCIRITSPGTDWTFSVDMAVLSGIASGAAYSFYASDDCTGGALSNGTIGPTTSSTMQNFGDSFTYDTAANGANSVLIGIETGAISGSVTGCFDNVVFSASGATNVTLQNIGATQPVYPLATAGIALSLGIFPLLIVLNHRRAR